MSVPQDSKNLALPIVALLLATVAIGLGLYKGLSGPQPLKSLDKAQANLIAECLPQVEIPAGAEVTLLPLTAASPASAPTLVVRATNRLVLPVAVPASGASGDKVALQGHPLPLTRDSGKFELRLGPPAQDVALSRDGARLMLLRQEARFGAAESPSYEVRPNEGINAQLDVSDKGQRSVVLPPAPISARCR